MATKITDAITSPTLLLDEDKSRANIRHMSQKARLHGVELRPHFKTHQSSDIGEWFRDEGVEGITVSSVAMARYFSSHGWKDITIAFPVNLREINQINQLAKQVNLTLLVSDSSVLEELQGKLTNMVRILIEIDTGSNRSGFKPKDTEALDTAIDFLNASVNLNFYGFYSHPGHSYSAQSKEEIQSVHQAVVAQCKFLRKRYGASTDAFTICIGDTPCCSVGEDFTPIDQISPGNFVFYDVMQTHIGSCSTKDIAVTLACPVVAKYPERREIIIHGGAIHLSKEKLVTEDRTHYGLPVLLNDTSSWSEPIKDTYLSSLSQEHGIIKCGEKFFSSVKVGDLLGILPVHSCLTADLMMGYQNLNGSRLNHIRIK